MQSSLNVHCINPLFEKAPTQALIDGYSTTIFRCNVTERTVPCDLILIVQGSSYTTLSQEACDLARIFAVVVHEPHYHLHQPLANSALKEVAAAFEDAVLLPFDIGQDSVSKVSF